MINIAFTGGGTGGHIFPGLAVASQLKNELSNIEHRIFWIGSSSGMDSAIVREAGIEFFGIPSGKLRRYFSLRTLSDFFKVIAGFFAARKILKKQKASLLFSKGGFVSVPPCAAASSLKIPVFTHESDFTPGLATKINARFVSRTKGVIFTAYESTSRFFPPAVRERVKVSGNPVRAVFKTAAPLKGREFLNVEKEARILLVLGGSQGALEINELIRETLNALTEIFTVVHQTGPNNEWDLPQTPRYKHYPFIKDELANIMAAAELIISRSGAGIWEFACLGKPMILIPLRGSGTRGDQVDNARYFEELGAARVITGDEVNAETLISAVEEIAHNNEKRGAMAGASAKIGQREGASFIARTLAEEIKHYLEERNECN
jgi:UDP-N-acetylglucosamine--N-acetylmuramyl-(pentapeptide) pyrophosphoryl-undecaprenol N-acetylglucosamine transferase